MAVLWTRVNWTGIDSQRCATSKPHMAPGTAVASWSGGPCYANLTLLQAAVTRQYCLQPSRSGASYCARSAGGCLPRSCAHWSEFGQARSAVKPGLQTERTRRKPHSVRGQIVLVGVVRAPGPAGPALAGSTVDGASPATLPGPDLGASFVSKLAARRYSAAVPSRASEAPHRHPARCHRYPQQVRVLQK